MSEKIRFQSPFSNSEEEERFLMDLHSPDFQLLNISVNSSRVDFLEIVVEDGQAQLAIELIRGLTSPDLDFELIKDTKPQNETEARNLELAEARALSIEELFTNTVEETVEDFVKSYNQDPNFLIDKLQKRLITIKKDFANRQQKNG